MTRSGAKFAMQGPLGEHFGHKIPEGVDDAWLDCWISLGMLKLDEPKNAEDKFKQELFRLGWASESEGFVEIFTCLKLAGLKIVEK